MEKICNLNLCTACGACAGVCPKNCIFFVNRKDQNGHVLPLIDQSQCIDCGLCARTCPVNHPINLSASRQAYASYSLNQAVCNTSSSGGLSYTLGKNIIERGGAVYGCVVNYGNDFGVCHKRIDTLQDLARTQTSKYVHSNIERNIYTAVKQDLEAGKEVLFTGTGCQIAGIRNFLKKEYPNFYAIDIICHGVPSLKLLKDYLRPKYDIAQIKSLSFRSKTGFNLYGVYGVYGVYGEKIDLPLSRNFYMMGFMKGLYNRRACYRCAYAGPERGGDITLGDFWGLKAKFANRAPESKGTSVVLINNDKGARLLASSAPALELLERPVAEAIAGNPQLNHPSKRHYAYNIFRKLYPIIGFCAAARICLVREKLFYAYALPLLNKVRR